MHLEYFGFSDSFHISGFKDLEIFKVSKDLIGRIRVWLNKYVIKPKKYIVMFINIVITYNLFPRGNLIR